MIHSFLSSLIIDLRSLTCVLLFFSFALWRLSWAFPESPEPLLSRACLVCIFTVTSCFAILTPTYSNSRHLEHDPPFYPLYPSFSQENAPDSTTSPPLAHNGYIKWHLRGAFQFSKPVLMLGNSDNNPMHNSQLGKLKLRDPPRLQCRWRALWETQSRWLKFGSVCSFTSLVIISKHPGR